MEYIDKIYGKFELSGVIEDLIKTSIFQRLRNIHQGGAIFLVNPEINHTRFEHSIGVMLLIRKMGGSIEEQIGGLIHDISHTAFSHLIDYVFEIEEEDYHEKRYVEVLKDEELSIVLQRYGFEVSTFFDIEKYPILDCPLPNLSADRIDYTLRDLFQLAKISKKEISWFLTGLHIFKKRMVLISDEYGRWFQSKYTFLVTEYFGGKENIKVNIIMKKIVLECLKKGTLEERDFYLDDFHIIAKIEENINLSKRIKELKENEINFGELKIKQRIVNPEILVNNQVVKLSEII